MKPPTVNTEKLVPNVTLRVTLSFPLNCADDTGFLYSNEILYFNYFFFKI